ncbi:sulfite exporter TauE/SafE family protein [Chitinophaga solisilvae]|uniref:sulfite exporter TauE/SafE family protein n=1 Tax=Chitinophaga solisilvae TaxID=1233460 RepID=UPI00136A2C11|nr:sulfite exporter TauE/SafE family protein [Chitinophaga solisilvae]
MVTVLLLLGILIGLLLGLTGAGGSILTVPVLVYIAGLETSVATAYSLFIVGVTALYGAAGPVMQGKVDFRTALLLAIPSFIAVFFTRHLLLPVIPEHWVHTGRLTIDKSGGLMLLFALVMLWAGRAMVTQPVRVTGTVSYPAVLIAGVLTGVVAGLVGAGGGFLIIPALILFAGMDMKTAVSTSLAIIAVNSLLGFSGDLLNGLHPDWRFLGWFSLLTVAGMMGGRLLERKVRSHQLKTLFGWLVMVLGVIIIIKELLCT